PDCLWDIACGGTCGNGLCDPEDAGPCPQECSVAYSDCCTEHPYPGCDDAAVMACVCDLSPDCCEPEMEWMSHCAEMAVWDCGLDCGGPTPEECGDGVDNDQNGWVDEGCTPCALDAECGWFGGGPCALPVCDVPSGTCVHQPVADGTPCDDGDACTDPDQCVGGGCASVPLSCDDGDACTVDECFPEPEPEGGCHHEPVSCEDGDPCTAAACDPLTGCGSQEDVGDVHLDGCCHPGVTWDVDHDCPGVCGNAACEAPGETTCTCAEDCGAETCGNGICCSAAGEDDVTCADDCFVSCWDEPELCFNQSGPCREMDCGPEGACEAIWTAPDGMECGTGPLGNPMVCVSGVCTCTPDCGGAQCGDDGCGGSCGTCPENWECIHSLCVLEPWCGDFMCNGAETYETCPADCPPECDCLEHCDDFQSCTIDACVAGHCVHTKVEGLCDDWEPCTTGDVCVDGVCTGTPTECSDGNPCTEDGVCLPGYGCWFANDLPGPCSDGNACTAGDTCQDGVCTGSPVSCDDGNPCTADSCLPVVGCQHVPAAGACDDGNFCTTGDICVEGVCAPGTAVDCSWVSDVCGAPTCNPATGECMVFEDGEPCDPGASDECMAGGACHGGACLPVFSVAGTPCAAGLSQPSCDPDVCDGQGGCVDMPPAPDGSPCFEGANTCCGGVCQFGDPGAGSCGECSLPPPDGLRVIIVESTSYNPGHTMDAEWLWVADGAGYIASVEPMSILDDPEALAEARILVVANAFTGYTLAREENIVAFLASGRGVYLQTEFDDVFPGNQAFGNIMALLGLDFDWIST
ncbi:MAG: hypothetical protein FJ098_12130, partial [Deltaproteobacteria bacterium]|nr:hypothetical protein [Deltaproteobacteria bacterium]